MELICLQIASVIQHFLNPCHSISSWLKRLHTFLGRNLADTLTAVGLLRKARARFFGEFDGKKAGQNLPKTRVT